jgi:hypothetical protein
MFDTLLSQIGVAAVVLVCAFALLKGDEPERLGAGAYLIAVFASLLLQQKGALSGIQWGLLVIDAALVAVYAGLVWKSRRSWPVWACALQALIVMCHLLTLIDSRPPLAAFYAVINLAGYGVLLSLASGTLQAWRERRATGSE